MRSKLPDGKAEFVRCFIGKVRLLDGSGCTIQLAGITALGIPKAGIVAWIAGQTRISKVSEFGVWTKRQVNDQVGFFI